MLVTLILAVLTGLQSPDPSKTDSWKANVNYMPVVPKGGPPLIIQGVVTLGHPDYKLELEIAKSQSDDPKQLILDLKITELPGKHRQVITKFDVQFEASPSPKTGPPGRKYTTILIRYPNNKTINIKVQTLH